MHFVFTLLLLLFGVTSGLDNPRSITIDAISTISQLHNASFDVSLANNNDLVVTNGIYAYIMTRKVFDPADWYNYNTYQLYQKDITNTQTAGNLIVLTYYFSEL